jgi:outer membrane protein OmpA-like peptidoglycan-associated protein
VTVEKGSGEADLAAYLGSHARGTPGASKTFSMEGMNYESGSAKLLPESYARVDALAELLKAYPTVHVRLVGHTDNTGDPAGNKPLSIARAQDMRTALIRRGIAPGRIQIDGYGSANPVATNDTPEGRARNRRIDVVLLNH